jgi:hypothetical protein
MRRAAPAALLLAAVGLACATLRGHNLPAHKILPVKGLGGVEVEIPPGWEISEAEVAGDRDASAQLQPADHAFAVLLSPVANPQPDERDGGETAQVLVELSRRKAAAGAVEKEIPLMELVGKDGVRGYWYVVTDRSLEGRTPGRDEYRYLLQGAAAVGPILLTFTVLDNHDGPHRNQVLDLVRNAHLTAAAPPGPGAPPAAGAERDRDQDEDGPGFEPDPGAQTVPLVVHDPGGRVTVLVDLSGFRMFKPRPGPSGESVIVLGEHPDDGIVASVILKDAAGADARRCRDAALARIERATPGLAQVRRGDAGGTARLSYALEPQRGKPLRQVHAHAFVVRAGVCVNLHVSKADPDPADGAKIEQILASLRFGESL